MEILVFYAIAIEPIKVQTYSASQNDRLNLSFVKDVYVVAKKLSKMAIFETNIFKKNSSKIEKHTCQTFF